MTFDDMWKSLEEKDTTGKYKQAREIAELNMEQLEFAYNSGYADAKSKYESEIIKAYTKGFDTGVETVKTERPKGEWVFHNNYHENCKYGCNQCGNLNNIPSNFCPNCGAKMQKSNRNETTFDDYLKEQLKDPDFRNVWEKLCKEWEKLCEEDMQKEKVVQNENR